MVGGAGGNGAMFRARSEEDAKLHARELAERGGRPARSRREKLVALLLVVFVLVGWGLYELLA